MYYFLVQTREFEDTIYRLYQQGKIVGGAYSGRGNEATAVGSAYALGPEDYVFPLHRDLGAAQSREAIRWDAGKRRIVGDEQCGNGDFHQ